MSSFVIIPKAELEELIHAAITKAMASNPAQNKATSNVLTITEAAEYLKIAKQTLYTYTSKRLIPFLKKGKFVYFHREQIDAWLASGYKKTYSEI